MEKVASFRYLETVSGLPSEARILKSGRGPQVPASHLFGSFPMMCTSNSRPRDAMQKSNPSLGSE
jgi:hypothetical protein